ncbi:MAG: hypothetical protein ACO1SX_14005 [Actinomycetota bacterium]
MTSRFARLRRSLKRLERRIMPVADDPDPDAWWSGLSDEGFLDEILPYCRREAGIDPGVWSHRPEYWLTYTTLAQEVVTVGEAGDVAEARRLFRELERLYRYRRRLGAAWWSTAPGSCVTA